MTTVRVRFAPSPTGYLHLGGIRSALFDYLLAQKTGGQFILRIEDTDRERLVDGALEQIKDSLDWLGLKYDEGPDTPGEFGPYIQSERLEIYAEHAKTLQDSGSLYPCWCTPERLTKLREEAQKAKIAFKYDRFCLENPQDDAKPHVLRFKVPENQTVVWDDAVKGSQSIQTGDVDDFVAIKSDGFPTYHFASVVDDHLMQISHVLRGDEWVASTPKHLLLYSAFGWQPPVFAHLPQVLGTDKAKLSKRHGAKSVQEYRHEGYLPEAVINFLVLLGWNQGDGTTQEIYSRAELVKAFSLEGINSSPAVFDPERLDWFNGKYIRSLTPDALQTASEGFWPPATDSTPKYRQQVLNLVQERLVRLDQLPEFTDFFFTDPTVDPKLFSDDSSPLLTAARDVLAKTEFGVDALEPALRQLAEDQSVKPGQLFSAIRIATTGRTAAPGLFETLAVLGQETVLRRLDKTIHSLRR